MNANMKNTLIETTTDEIAAMLRENIDGIDSCIAAGMVDHDKETPFKYRVSLGLVIEPRGSAVKVVATLSYSQRHKDESVGAIVDPNQTSMDLGA